MLTTRSGNGFICTIEQAAHPVIIQTELPADYLELEKRVDALKQVHQTILDVTYGRCSNTMPCLLTFAQEAIPK